MKKIKCTRCDGQGKCQQTDTDWDTCRYCDGEGFIEIPTTEEMLNTPSVKSTIINRHDICSQCGTNWDGGDVYEQLIKLDVFMHKGESYIKQLASYYGWSETNKVRFSNTIAIKLEFNPMVLTDIKDNSIKVNELYFQCPNCRHVWNATTGEHYNNIQEIKSLI